MNSISCEQWCTERSPILLHCVVQHKVRQMKINSQGVKTCKQMQKVTKVFEVATLHSAQIVILMLDALC